MSVIDQIPRLDGEVDTDTWSLLYEPPAGGKFNGKLLVTNRGLICDAKFDLSARGMIEELLFVKWGSEGCRVIPKDRIAKVDVKKSLFARRLLLTLDEGQVHTFNYGMLNIDPVAAAVRQQ